MMLSNKNEDAVKQKLGCCSTKIRMLFNKKTVYAMKELE